ncbi:MAG: hypothetical protein B0A82_01750 [Alkalinema sp. CACIAM 70d]|nr:MAG: hypothetical protein B0A82_01750 [Alkalinema sp. CACIAM 70d]
MLKQTFTIVALSTALAGSLVSAANATPQDFVGNWINVNSNTSGITRFVVTQQGKELRIQVFGKCHPTDCDWGSASLVTYGRNVEDPNHTAATTTYTPSFAKNTLVLNLQGARGSQINLQNFTQFVDNSNRQNYFTQESFRQVALTPRLVFKGTEAYTANGKQWIRYKLAIANKEIFPAELFGPAPDLPPCGSNTQASRTWVDIFNTANNQRIYGFCALSSQQDLDSLWFAVERGTAPPRQVYVVLTDRRTNTAYRSNSVTLR